MTADEISVVELRQYTLHPRQRDVLIGLFDREFVEPQEAVGMAVLGQFRDLDDPNRFVWLRGFTDMSSRHAGLSAFYGGPVWQAHAQAANATMVDSDNVLLLQPAWPGAGLPYDPGHRAAQGAAATPAGRVDLTIFYLKEPASPDLLDFCRRRMAAILAAGAALAQGWYITEPSENSFSRLPVREGESVLVGCAVFSDAAALDAFERTGAWQRDIAPALSQWLAREAEAHRLAPTARSALHA